MIKFPSVNAEIGTPVLVRPGNEEFKAGRLFGVRLSMLGVSAGISMDTEKPPPGPAGMLCPVDEQGHQEQLLRVVPSQSGVDGNGLLVGGRRPSYYLAGERGGEPEMSVKRSAAGKPAKKGTNKQ